MKTTAELHTLALICLATALMWIPYMLARIGTRGLTATLGEPSASGPADPAWAQRAKAAHLNAVENLAIFAPLVIIAGMAGISTTGTILATQLYLWARIAHYLVYAAGIPVVRTVAFVIGFGAMVFFALTILAGT